jgi:UDP-N-acetylmuramoyl-tripeptide--D-alanyl-D-alanine ligase
VGIFTLREIARIVEGRLASNRQGEMDRTVRRVWTDSRTIRSGDVFVALTGERFDGHQYVTQALRNGAVAALVRQGYESPPIAGALIKVDDPLRAFQALAAAHRRRFAIPVVAVTGSNGKTTTKTMIGSILSERFETLITAANYNNHIGVPQTMLRITPRHRAAVIEMGISAAGEMTRLCEIAAPTHGVVTNIGPAHLASFGSLEAVARAKGELLRSLPAEGTAILNADDAFFHELQGLVTSRVLSFGFMKTADVRALRVESDGTSFSIISVGIRGQKRPLSVTLRMAGRHNIANALAAIATGKALGIGAEAIRRGLARCRPAAMRSEVRRWGGVTVLNDCYNANPASVRAAVEWLAEAKGAGRSFVVLGDMLELGEEAVEFHRDVGRGLASRADFVLTTGILGAEIAAGALAGGMAPDHVLTASDHQRLAEKLRALARKGDVVLVKGSRGARMERVLEAL